MTEICVQVGRAACVLPVAAMLLGGCAVSQGAENVNSATARPQSLFGSLGATAVGPEKKSTEKPAMGPQGLRSERSLAQRDVQPALERSMPMQKVGPNAWRTSVPANVAFQTLSRVLSQTYVLALNNKKQMKISTDWDKFLIDGRLFRNRVEAAVFPVTARSTEVVIQNVVQAYEGDNSVNLRESNWIGTPDVTDEVQRIVGVFVRQSSSYARR